MNVHLENVNLNSSSGPNHFASKLITEFKKKGIKNDYNLPPAIRLCFIETYKYFFDNVPMVQRLDGIYFNINQNYNKKNSNIKKT